MGAVEICARDYDYTKCYMERFPYNITIFLDIYDYASPLVKEQLLRLLKPGDPLWENLVKRKDVKHVMNMFSHGLLNRLDLLPGLYQLVGHSPEIIDYVCFMQDEEDRQQKEIEKAVSMSLDQYQQDMVDWYNGYKAHTRFNDKDVYE